MATLLRKITSVATTSSFPLSPLLRKNTSNITILETNKTAFHHHHHHHHHHLLLAKPMSWSCKRCTFLNSPSKKSTCEICLSPYSPPPPPLASTSSTSPSSFSKSNEEETPKWSCKACTFLNVYSNSTCDVCGTRAPLGSLSTFHDLNDSDRLVDDEVDLDSSVGSVFFPLRPCKRKVRDPPVPVDDHQELDGIQTSCKSDKVQDAEDGGYAVLGGFEGFGASNKAVTVVKNDNPSAAAVCSFKILSYNVWFREDVELHKRMEALGDLIQLHSPDIICFQEVTPNIYVIFQQSNWWRTYRCSVSKEMANTRAYFCMLLSRLPVKSFSSRPFRNSIMGRELCVAELEVGGRKPLVVATSHLESPCPAPPKWDQMYSKERVEQAKEAINYLNKYPNVIFGGDMNWDDKTDGGFPLSGGWKDAWAELRGGDNGWTYDTKSNQMLSANWTLQKRLDRFVCSLCDLKISKIDMIGKEAIPGLSYTKEKKVRGEVKMLKLPVLPSDHYGLVLTVSGL